MFFFKSFIEFINSVISVSVFQWIFVFPVFAFLLGVLHQLLGGRRR